MAQELLDIRSPACKIFSGEYHNILSVILDNLDNESITNCLLVNKNWKTGVTLNNVYWRRRERGQVRRVSKKQIRIARRAKVETPEVSLIVNNLRDIKSDTIYFGVSGEFYKLSCKKSYTTIHR